MHQCGLRCQLSAWALKIQAFFVLRGPMRALQVVSAWMDQALARMAGRTPVHRQQAHFNDMWNPLCKLQLLFFSIMFCIRCRLWHDSKAHTTQATGEESMAMLVHHTKRLPNNYRKCHLGLRE
jgi:hypothetical protein